MKSISTSRIPAKRNAISTWYSYDIKTPKSKSLEHTDYITESDLKMLD